MKYGYSKQIDLPFGQAVERTKAELAKEGFGVLTEIDVKATLKKKLDVEWDNYIILGVCHPTYAYQALQAEREIGLFLPCNVIVYEDKGRIVVSVIIPTVAMKMIENEPLREIARKAEGKLIKVVNSI